MFNFKILVYMKTLNVLFTVFLLVIGLSMSSQAQFKNGDAFPSSKLKGRSIFTCGDKLVADVTPTSSSGISRSDKSYLTSVDGLNWVPTSIKPCNTPEKYAPMPFEVKKYRINQTILNKNGVTIRLQEKFTVNGKTYHFVRQDGPGSTPPITWVALVEGSGENRDYSNLSPKMTGADAKHVYQHPENPSKLAIIYDYKNSTRITLGTLASDGKSFSFSESIVFPDQAYTSLTFFDNKMYVMGGAKLVSYDLAPASDNGKFLVSKTPNTIIGGGYDVRGLFMHTTGSTPRLFVLHNYQTSGSIQLDEILANGSAKRNLFNDAKINISVKGPTKPTLRRTTTTNPALKKRVIKKKGN